MNSSTLTRLELDEHLAKGIPALSEAAGLCDAGFGDKSRACTCDLATVGA